MLLPILGTSWVFGVLAVSDRALVFQYMFAVLNSLQVRGACRPTGWQHGLLPSSLLGVNTKVQLRQSGVLCLEVGVVIRVLGCP